MTRHTSDRSLTHTIPHSTSNASPMKSLLLFFIAGAVACNEPNNSNGSSTTETAGDTMPTMKPDVTDTTRVVTPPPTGDSNVVRPDTTVKSK